MISNLWALFGSLGLSVFVARIRRKNFSIDTSPTFSGLSIESLRDENKPLATIKRSWDIEWKCFWLVLWFLEFWDLVYRTKIFHQIPLKCVKFSVESSIGESKASFVEKNKFGDQVAPKRLESFFFFQFARLLKLRMETNFFFQSRPWQKLQDSDRDIDRRSQVRSYEKK